MEKEYLVSFINAHYDSLLSQVNAEAESQTLQAENFENIDEKIENIKNDKEAFIVEINKSREMNIQNLDSEPEVIEKLHSENFKNEIFCKIYCIFFQKEYALEQFGSHIGFMIKLPFYIDDKMVQLIKLVFLIYIF